MRGLRRLEACLGLCVLAASAVLHSSVCVAGQPGLRTTLGKSWERRALERSLSGAVRRLAHPRCQRIFADFRDASGQLLQARLDAVGQTAASFMVDWIFFADGRDEPRCADARVLAVTQPGSRSVWICGRQFSREHRRDPAETEAVLIHEALHVLGLGEDPPSSEAITRQVVARCGS